MHKTWRSNALYSQNSNFHDIKDYFQSLTLLCYLLGDHEDQMGEDDKELEDEDKDEDNNDEDEENYERRKALCGCNALV